MRLDIWLGGNSVADTLLFGTDVLSCPGSLSPKNIRDVENNLQEAPKNVCKDDDCGMFTLGYENY